MKVLLIQPPWNRRMITMGRLEPLGLEIIGAAIPQHEVRLLDMRFDRGLDRALAAFKPDVVGITAISTEASTAVEALRAIKRFNAGITTVAGGHHATMLPGDFCNNGADIAVLGHGYRTFPELLKAIQEKRPLDSIPGLAFRRNGQMTITQRREIETITDMPRPNRALAKAYRSGYSLFTRRAMALVMTATGCPFRCTFCACWKVTGGIYRAREPEDVVDEIASLAEEHVFLADDNTFHSVERAMRIADLIEKRGIRKTYSGYARSDTITRHPELIAAWARIGLQALVIGMEAIDNHGLTTINKSNSVENNEAASSILHANGVINLAHFLVRQDFTEHDFEALYRYVERCDIWWPFFTVVTPLPGTVLNEQVRERILTKGYDLYDLTHSVLPTAMPMMEFVRRLNRLYSRSYSFRRYLRRRLIGPPSPQKPGLPAHRRRPLISFLELLVAKPFFFHVGRRLIRNHLGICAEAGT